MQTTIRKLGNSKAVIIPATFLASIGIEKSVKMELKSGSIVITPIHENPRKGWYDQYQATQDDNAWQDFKALESEQDDWQW